jgi:lipoyl-dependent peroxiredoxin
LTSRAWVPALDEPGLARLAGEVEKHCPVSKVLNATITLDLKSV